MSFTSRLAGETGISEELLPSSYQIVGDVLLLKMLKLQGVKEKQKVASALLEMFPYVKTVGELAGIGDEFRTPSVRKLAGNGFETAHKEHGILYRLDASRIMFSKGNHYERQRLISKVRDNEVIIDMFAGIGYFSLGIARYTRAAKIHAIEKNPLAYRYLAQNIALNKAATIEPLLGDNRTLAGTLAGKADRILMGYFPGTETFLPHALRLLKQRGTIHFHNTYATHELWKKPLKDIAKAFGEKARFSVKARKKVKSVAPHTYHVVLDIEATIID
ncbi:MAG: class I SAM-dependent methyltransferase family protein [Candidatus Aenigmarchaeota archaeon]|nr:class I SAM-dependent methyltransferase family protein [Candidatus Aenigmarchaeota archaeon]